MATNAFSPSGAAELAAVLREVVDSGFAPGATVLLARHGEVHAEAVGHLDFDGSGATATMGTDTICRLGSMSKPIITACVMTLVDDGTLGLDDPVDRLLPELADMRVLTDPHAALDDTVPTARAITVRDILDYTLGTGMVLAEPGVAPIADAMEGLDRSSLDTWIAGLGALPLVHQPGERWLYHTAADVTGVLIERATGMRFGDALQQRVCGPLGMRDTGFSVPDDRLDRFSATYALDEATGARTFDDFSHGTFRGDVAFESGGGGLVSTADDVLVFARAMMGGGAVDGRRLLSAHSVAAMTSDQLTEQQKAVSGFWPGYFDEMGWGFGMSVRTEPAAWGAAVGTYGWPGYFGTAWYNDPANDLVAIVMMQHSHGGNQRLPMWHDIWHAVYRTIAD